MPYQWVDDPEEQEEGNNPPAQGNLPNPAREQMRKMEKENAELKKQLTQFQEEKQKSLITGLVKDKGYDPDIAGMVPESIKSEDDLNKWLERNSKFLVKVASDAGANPSAEPAASVSPEVQSAMGQISGASAGTLPRGSTEAARIQGAQTPEDLKAILADLQGGVTR